MPMAVKSVVVMCSGIGGGIVFLGLLRVFLVVFAFLHGGFGHELLEGHVVAFFFGVSLCLA